MLRHFECESGAHSARRIVTVVVLAIFGLGIPRFGAAQGSVTPLDIMLACKRAGAVTDTIHRFCHELHAPTSVRKLTMVEWTDWTTQVPSVATLIRYRDLATASASKENALRADLSRVSFGTGEVRRDTSAVLDGIAQQLVSDPYLNVELVGLASAPGTRILNDSLSKARAEFVRAYLLERGVREDQVRPVSYDGNRRALALSGQQRTLDESLQRVDIRVLDAPQSPRSWLLSNEQEKLRPKGLTAEALVTGLTDYLIAEAVREVEQQAIARTIRRVCDGSLAARMYIPASCFAFDSARTLLYTPPVARLRSAIKQDLRSLPSVLVEMPGADANRRAARCALILSTRYYGGIANGEAPSRSILKGFESTNEECANALGSGLSEAAKYLGTVREAVIDLGERRPDDRLTREEIVDYSIKALAVNAGSKTAALTLQRASRLVLAVERTDESWRSAVAALEASRGDTATRSKSMALLSLLERSAAAHEALLEVVDSEGRGRMIRLSEQIRAATGSLSTGRYGDALNTLALAADSAGVRFDLPASQRLAFAADLADAENSDDVSRAFRAYGNPVGTVAMKRANSYYWTLNGYAGVSAGGERAARKVAATTSIHLPIGIEIGHGLVDSSATKARTLSSIGLLFQVINLGGVASVRLGSSDSLQQVPPTTLAAIWAPGMHLRMGIGRSRFVFGPGVEYVPAGRREKVGGAYSSAIRFLMSAAVDVPLYPF